MDVMNRFGGPPQNVVLADDRGHIGWTYLGRLPLRKGFDGSMARPWAEGKLSWQGYIAPADLPRVIDPPSGFLATANSRNLGRDYPHVIAHNQASGYRAYRISQRLRELEQLTEKDMLNLQLDTRSEFYDYYRQLAFSVLDAKSREEVALNEAAIDIARWDGKLEADSQGIALLIAFRRNLAEQVFAPIVARCRQWDAGFTYRWRLMDAPLRALLSEQSPQTLPASHASWRQLIQEALRSSVRELKEKYQVDDLGRLSWGKVNRIAIQHPFGKTSSLLSPLFDMPAVESPGCASACVRIISESHGASERMVVSPSHPDDGILHMPGGQSGNVLSSNYRDQQPAWRDGTVLPFNPGKTRHTLRLLPQSR
jgi:penicillin G amidase